MPSCPGSTARIPPPTPLFAGKPTVVTQSPAASYIPQVVMTLSTCRTSGAVSARSRVRGCTPLLASVAAISARSRQVMSMEHCRK